MITTYSNECIYHSLPTKGINKRKPNFNAHVMDYEGSSFPFQGKVKLQRGFSLVPMVIGT
jgi:hypothetical protein